MKTQKYKAMINANLKPRILSILISSIVLTACHSSVEKQNAQELAGVETALSEADVLVDEPGFNMLDTMKSQDEMELSAYRVSGMIERGKIFQASQPSIAYFNDYELAYERAAQEKYAELKDSSVKVVTENPVSTFSIDVDTGAYSNIRRFLNQGNLPPVDAVRAEELINYFSYDYPVPEKGMVPFSFNTEISVSPWNENKHLLHVGLQAFEPNAGAQQPSNLVFLVDVSGSMNSPEKLGLLKTSLKLLTQQLTREDSVAIAVYAGASGVVLEPTAGNSLVKIAAALEQLQAGGGTNGVAGIQLAYALAQDAFIDGGVNRVILATDGDFNVGMASVADLKKLIEEKRKSGITLTTLGFGSGNYNDAMMEQLADAGNGNYAYIDNINEARKVLVDELNSTLQVVAKDVKIQVEFNPAVVAEYRLVGYENRGLQREDFNNDKVDAGEIGAGHSVTAIYEIALVGSSNLNVEPLRYGETDEVGTESVTNGPNVELAFLKLRYKVPNENDSQLLEKAIRLNTIKPDLNSSSDNYRFATAVAGFAQLLRDNSQVNHFEYEEVLALANSAKGEDLFGYRSEFINLVRTAQILSLH